MLTAAQRKKKRIALIAVWVIYSIAASLFLFHLAREKTSDKAQEDLYVQADSIAAQIPSVLENSLYCEISSLKMKTAKLNALVLALNERRNHLPSGRQCFRIYPCDCRDLHLPVQCLKPCGPGDAGGDIDCNGYP